MYSLAIHCFSVFQARLLLLGSACPNLIMPWITGLSWIFIIHATALSEHRVKQIPNPVYLVMHCAGQAIEHGSNESYQLC